jgi:8-oxo-dGTP pyrophosphatase MutT (NUDIX family)
MQPSPGQHPDAVNADLPQAWLQRVRERIEQPPARPRLHLQWGGHTIGSVEPALLQALWAKTPNWRDRLRLVDTASPVHAELSGAHLTALLAELAGALRDAGLAHAWRNEQLPVRSSDGSELGTIERAAVRPLGIATRAVHLCGTAPDGAHWVQLRSMTKATDPGRWDTLVGGMVAAGQSVLGALERETWEEAGLQLARLGELAPGGVVTVRGPSAAGAMAYTVETIDWYFCVVPEGVTPLNQDGEVERFERLAPDMLRERLLAGGFTAEAEVLLAAAAFGVVW